MGLGYQLPTKKPDHDRAASYGAWVTKYTSTQQNSVNGWKGSVENKNSKGKPENPWGPVFKSKQDFLDMHFC